MLWPLLLLHITAATIGLISGYTAMMLRKGSGPHGAAGTIFFASMLAMSSSAAWIAAFLRPNMLNVVVGLLTFYLVATAWRTARRKDGAAGVADLIALVYVSAVAAAAWTFGFEAAGSVKGSKDGMPAALYFVFGSIALLCAVSDVRMLVRGGVSGPRRIARHLWRMCLALLIATVSFYPGQASLFPLWLRESKVLLVPHVLLIGSMIFWRVRVVRRRRVETEESPGGSGGVVMANGAIS